MRREGEREGERKGRREIEREKEKLALYFNSNWQTLTDFSCSVDDCDDPLL